MKPAEFVNVQFYGYDFGIVCNVCRKGFPVDNLAELLIEAREHNHEEDAQTERAKPSALDPVLQEIYGPDICRQLGIESPPGRATS